MQSQKRKGIGNMESIQPEPSRVPSPSLSPHIKQTTKATLKKPKKMFKFRFLSETSLHNVRRDQIYFYILSLHKKIRLLLRRCKKYREKILKLVSFLAFGNIRVVNCLNYF